MIEGGHSNISLLCRKLGIYFGGGGGSGGGGRGGGKKRCVRKLGGWKYGWVGVGERGGCVYI